MSKIPEFKTALEESDFWDTHDLTDFLDELTPVDVHFIDARPRDHVLFTLRLDPATAKGLGIIAGRKHMGRQRLIREWIEAQVAAELGPSGGVDTTSDPAPAPAPPADNGAANGSRPPIRPRRRTAGR